MVSPFDAMGTCRTRAAGRQSRTCAERPRRRIKSAARSAWCQAGARTLLDGAFAAQTFWPLTVDGSWLALPEEGGGGPGGAAITEV